MRHVHPSKITKASYSQADVVVVGKKCRKTMYCDECVCFTISQYERNIKYTW